MPHYEPNLALFKQAFGNHITDCRTELIKIALGWSRVYRVTLTREGHPPRQSVIVKTIDPNGPATSLEAERELRFYQTLFTHLSIPKPEIYFLTTDAATGFHIIVMEDLALTHRELMGGEIQEILLEFDKNGSLATTHASQGTDMGLFGGLLGWEATDERLVSSPKLIQEAGIKFAINIIDYGAQHPNTYRLTLNNSYEKHSLTAISVGGGMIEVIEIDSHPISITGDYFETLIYLNSSNTELMGFLREKVAADEIILLENQDPHIIEVKSQSPLEEIIITELFTRFKDC